MTRVYPTKPAGPFDSPPTTFEDRASRPVEVRKYTTDDFEPLVAMYAAFDPTDRAQGLPPTSKPRIRDWLDHILTDDAINVVAQTDTRLVGHAMLVPDADDASELAIFVVGNYQDVGIGTGLITALLGAGAEQGIERVWLTVERWNAAARALYRKVGFEPCKTENYGFEMSLRLCHFGLVGSQSAESSRS
jgi:ribosomal protein S18 acetylase RimI-like enzyme